MDCVHLLFPNGFANGRVQALVEAFLLSWRRDYPGEHGANGQLVA